MDRIDIKYRIDIGKGTVLPVFNLGQKLIRHIRNKAFGGLEAVDILQCFRDLPRCHPFGVHGYDLLIDIGNIFLAFLYHLWLKGGVTILWDFNFHASIAAIYLFGFIAIAIVIAIGTF